MQVTSPDEFPAGTRARDFDVGLVDVPTVADRMATWAGRVGGPFDPKHFDVAAVNVALQRLR